ncbi:MAG: M48 family peptidase [Candidatus Abyssobacteria bacterium SURF_17]|uniref:M48 family peptidase n=1 Tax=Candidatus Abyssobacteria bacterium SURF_17 TaxID=2093361 RepID=A0A419ENE5_9BACT|nr:MAG: M48 family peptidase [Candidatus Abyssubacteria bacterium SURF_17]
MRALLCLNFDFSFWIDPNSQTGREDERAKTYNRTKRVLFVVELVYALAFLLILLVSGASSALARSLEILATNIWLTVLLYVFIVGVAYDVIAVPLEFYGGFVHEHRYGQSTQTFSAWAWDQIKSKVVGFAIAAPLIEALYWLLRAYPHRWWLIASVLFIAFAVVMANIAPVLLMPIFYKFIPLRDEELKKRLLALCEKVNTKVRGVYEMDMSRKTRAANAALVGLGNTRRIVLGDTLFERYEPDEIEAILAHELGHHMNWDMWKGLLFQSAISMLGFFVASVVLNAYGASFGSRGPADITSFPLLVLTCAGVALVFLPVSNAFSRRLERRADSFALTITGDPAAFVSMMLKLGEQNLSEFEPNPIVEFILYSHPSVKRRIAHARRMFPAFEGKAAEG